MCCNRPLLQKKLEAFRFRYICQICFIWAVHWAASTSHVAMPLLWNVVTLFKDQTHSTTCPTQSMPSLWTLCVCKTRSRTNIWIIQIHKIYKLPSLLISKKFKHFICTWSHIFWYEGHKYWVTRSDCWVSSSPHTHPFHLLDQPCLDSWYFHESFIRN